MDASVNRIPISKDEKSFLISIRLPISNIKSLKYSLEELVLLTKTAGAQVKAKKIINRQKIDSSFIVGKGYVETLKEFIESEKITLIIFDLNNIRPAQIRNLEEKLKCRVVGRTEVILDIFARRARSSEAKIQVELAQLNYLIPRLKGYGDVLSRLGGGIGTRGPGEKMLETDKRHILRRISTLKKKLKGFEKHRSVIRKSRSSEVVGAVAGYTNAGKSTLINRLAKDDLFVENRLFATLDSYTRTVFLEHQKKLLLTDTVGFISNLPTTLIASFKSTLEEITEANFVLHVVDINAEDMENNISTVEKELLNLDVNPENIVLFFNKSDLMDENMVKSITNQYPGSIAGSAITGEGLDKLKEIFIEKYNNITMGDEK